jgi:hypothetical protein
MKHISKTFIYCKKLRICDAYSEPIRSTFAADHSDEWFMQCDAVNKQHSGVCGKWIYGWLMWDMPHAFMNSRII